MATPISNAISLTGDARIDGLVQGSAWSFGGGAHVITYSFSANDSPAGGPWTGDWMDAMMRAFAEWSKVANLQFVQSSGGLVFTQSLSDISLTLTGNELQLGLGALALGVFPDPVFASELRSGFDYTAQEYPNPEGDIFFDNYHADFQSFGSSSLGFNYLLHEIGHALGLKHPFDDGGNGRPTFLDLGMGAKDSNDYTVMSDTYTSGTAGTPMPFDILTIQHIYGANTTYAAGDDTYDISFMPRFVGTVWDTGGTDTFTTNWGLASTLDLRPGEFSRAGQLTTAIAYNVTIEHAIGSDSADTIIGNDANNRLQGNRGNDSITGGAGVDTAVFSQAKSQYAVTKNGTNLTVSNFWDGTDSIAGVERLHFADGVWSLPGYTRADYNFDGNSDLLLRNADGRLATYLMNGSQFSGHYLATGLDPGWAIVDSHGDYNGDGKSDLLWRNDSGWVATWLMNGSQFTSHYLNVDVADESWTIVSGHADYNGDGKTDLLWRNTDGTVVFWLMDGAQFTGHYMSGNAIPDWGIVGTHGDYNGDGKSDILLRNNDQLNMWLMNGADGLGHFVARGVDLTWSILDSQGDYDGDGKSDLLFRNTDGRLAVWLMDGGTFSGHYLASGLDDDWQIIGTHGDYNGDGKSDLLWRHSSGWIATWLMDGEEFTSSYVNVNLADSNWTVIDTHGDHNGDGKSDVLWRNSDGTLATWLMDGSQFTGHYLGAVESSWTLV